MSKTTNWLMEIEETLLNEYSSLTPQEIKDIPLELDADHFQFNLITDNPDACFEIEINHPLYQRMFIALSQDEVKLLIKELSELDAGLDDVG